MNLYDFLNPEDPRFRRVEVEGTHDPAHRCPECMRPDSRVQPLVVSWARGPEEQVGDFLWPDFFGSDIAMTERVAVALEPFSGFDAGPVKFRGRKFPSHLGKAPRLYDLWVTSHVPFDTRRSTVKKQRDCPRCGLAMYEVSGQEERESRWNERTQALVWRVKPRRPNQGILVRRRDLKGVDIFRIPELPAFITCTQRVKDRIEAAGFTNVAFREIGEVV